MARGSLRRSFIRAIPVVLSVLPAWAQFIPNRYTLLLEDPPVASHFQRREEIQSAAAGAYRAQIEAKQEIAIRELQSRGIPVTGSVTDLLNAVFVRLAPDRVSEVGKIPGVVAVRPMRRFKPLLNRATQLMTANPTAWNLVGGQNNAGKGIKIAILDSGIDNTHPSFQDSSLSMPSGFPKCSGFPNYAANCGTYTNSKVIVARSYVEMLATGSGIADDYTPRDHDGHGTAVASAAAGNQAAGTVTFTGMAPHAYLGNYKIYGTPGVNDNPGEDVLTQALQDAISDGMNIVVVPYGTAALTGATDTGATCNNAAGAACDPLAMAFETAAQMGTVIVVAAGDENYAATYQTYPYFNSILSPATAPSVIAVGATTNSHALLPTVSVSGGPSSLQGIAADTTDATWYGLQLYNNEGFFVSGAISAALLDVSQLGNDGFACTTLPAGSLNGKFALIEATGTGTSDSCSAPDAATNAETAGAWGVIFYLSSSGTLTATSGFVDAGVYGPVVSIGNSDGVNLKSYIDANPNQTVTIDPAGREVDLSVFNSLEGVAPSIVANQLASYSSFGPTPDGAIKPDLVATGGLDLNLFASFGENVLSYGMYMAAQNLDPNGSLYSASRYAAADGTSFAAGVAGGAAALVMQANPSFKAADVKSALVNAASHTTTSDDSGQLTNLDAEELGGGRLDAGAAASAAVTAAPATISFGYLKSGAVSVSKTLTITNRGSGSVTLAIAVTPTVSGITVAASAPSLTLAAGASGTLTATLSGTAPTFGEYSGFVTLKASGVNLSVPYMFLVGSGVANGNVIPLVYFLEGTTGEAVCCAVIQVVDGSGVPVVGYPVSFSTTGNAVTFQTAGAGTTSTCSPNNSSSSACVTDNYGMAWAQVTLGSTAGQPSVTAAAAGNTLDLDVTILPHPVVTQVIDNAAYQTPVAPGSYVAIKGSGLMNPSELVNTAQGYDVAATATFPLVLDGVNVSFDVPSANLSVPAPVFATSVGQVNVQVPWELEGQTSAQVKVIIDETTVSTPVTVALANYTPAFFTYTANSVNVADAINSATGQLVTSSNPAVRGGSIIELFANGLGPVNSIPADGSPIPLAAQYTQAASTTTPCTVSIGGQQAPVSFCGIAPNTPAEYQVNVQVPSNISTGNQPISISIGGVTSPSGVVIPVQ
jgi:minor extracellular serine protease Vpr